MRHCLLVALCIGPLGHMIARGNIRELVGIGGALQLAGVGGVILALVIMFRRS